jgi:hypothetical protein
MQHLQLLSMQPLIYLFFYAMDSHFQLISLFILTIQDSFLLSCPLFILLISLVLIFFSLLLILLFSSLIHIFFFTLLIFFSFINKTLSNIHALVAVLIFYASLITLHFFFLMIQVIMR